MSPPVSVWLSLASSLAICGLFLPDRHTCRPTRAWFESSLFAWVLSLAFVTCCIALLLSFHGAWSRRVIRSFQLKVLQYLPDMSLTRLDCDAVTTPYNDTGQYYSTLVKVCIFPSTCFWIWYFLDIILTRNSTAGRCPPFMMSSPCTVTATCSPLMQPCHTHKHAIPLVNLRSLS